MLDYGPIAAMIARNEDANFALSASSWVVLLSALSYLSVDSFGDITDEQKDIVEGWLDLADYELLFPQECQPVNLGFALHTPKTSIADVAVIAITDLPNNYDIVRIDYLLRSHKDALSDDLEVWLPVYDDADDYSQYTEIDVDGTRAVDERNWGQTAFWRIPDVLAAAQVGNDLYTQGTIELWNFAYNGIKTAFARGSVIKGTNNRGLYESQLFGRMTGSVGEISLRARNANLTGGYAVYVMGTP